MAGKYPAMSLIAIGLLVLNLAAFFVLLGGAAGLQKDGMIVSGLLNTLNGQPQSLLSYGDLKPFSTNGNFISFQWFKAVAQCLTILAALGALAAGAFHQSRIALVGMFAALAVLFSNSSDTFYYLYLQTHTNTLVPQKIKREVTAYFSGCIMSATLNFLLVIVLGLGAGTATTTAATAAHPGPAPIKDTNGSPAV